MQQIINDIRTFHRERCFVMEQRKRMHLALTAFLRMSLGWRMELPEAERRAIATRALEMAEGVEEDHPLHGVIAASLAARAPFDQLEKNATKQMEKLAKQLPVWTAWGEGVRAFGARSLAVIVGEAGDLSNYATHSKLWKRMGLAVMDGAHDEWDCSLWAPRWPQENRQRRCLDRSRLQRQAPLPNVRHRRLPCKAGGALPGNLSCSQRVRTRARHGGRAYCCAFGEDTQGERSSLHVRWPCA